MTFPLQIERERGRKEAGQQLEQLRERWPLAFPVQAQDVRPLAMGVANQIAETMGWSLSYSVGVLTYWKMQRPTVGPCLTTTSASPLTARRSKRSTRGRRIWRPSN